VKTWHDSNRKTSYRNRGNKFFGKGKGHKYRFRTEIKTCCFHEKVPFSIETETERMELFTVWLMRSLFKCGYTIVEELPLPKFELEIFASVILSLSSAPARSALLCYSSGWLIAPSSKTPSVAFRTCFMALIHNGWMFYQWWLIGSDTWL
jgi:hypothetical protein